MVIENFTPVSAAIGGLLIGAGAMLMILLNGRVAGVSGILGSVVVTPLMNALRQSDYYLVTADFDAYCATQRRVDALWESPAEWARVSILNIAGMAWFSSDRTIREYAEDIWHVPVLPTQPVQGKDAQRGVSG